MPKKTARKSTSNSRKRSQGFSWKVAKKTAKAKKLIRKYTTAAFVFLLCFGFLVSLFVYKSLTVPFVSASGTSAYDILNEEIVTAIIVTIDNFGEDPLLIENLSYVIIDKKGEQVIIYEIPDDYALDLPGKFGTEEISKSLALGMVTHGDLEQGISLLISSVEKLFGYKVNRYIIQEKKANLDFNEMFKGNLSLVDVSLQNVSTFGTSVRTNLSLGEFYNLYTFINTVSKNDITAKSFSTSFMKNSGNIDNQIREITLDSTLAAERKSVAVLNGTNVPGVAALGARFIENSGSHVVLSDNAVSAYSESILVLDTVNSKTAQEIIRHFGIDNIVLKKNAGDLLERGVDRSDITLIFGLDVVDGL